MGLSKTALLAAIVITYMTTGTLDFKAGGIFTSGMPAFLVTLSFVLFIAGFAKAAIMPLHNWLPSAMVAPTPVSALLHAVAVVKVGVFSVVRVMLDVFGIDVLSAFNLGMPTVYFVSFTIILASIIALTKDDLKAIRLAALGAFFSTRGRDADERGGLGFPTLKRIARQARAQAGQVMN